MLGSNADHHEKRNGIWEPSNTLIPTKDSLGHLVPAKRRHWYITSEQADTRRRSPANWILGASPRQLEKGLTKRETSPIMTMPKSQVSLLDTLAKVWPPMIQLSIRKPSKLNTLRRLGTMDPRYLPPPKINLNISVTRRALSNEPKRKSSLNHDPST